MRTTNDLQAQVPKFADIMFPCLKALMSLGGSGTNEEILDRVCELEKIPDDVQRVQGSNHGQTMLGYRLAWARSFLKKVGAVQNTDRGVWAITEKGQSLTEAECKKIPSAVRKLENSKRKGGSEPNQSDNEYEDNEAEDDLAWRDRLLGVVQKIKPDAFERLAQRILREAGFTKVEVTGKSGDGGIDGVGILRVNLVSFTVLFQCKRYQGSVRSSDVRDFRGAMQGRCDKGLFITTGTFSPDARREATRDGAPTIDLIDGEALCELLKSLKLGISVELVEQVAIDEGWFALI